MTRAGREPAEDVQRRLVAACQEVGLLVNAANMHLSKAHGVRLILFEKSTWKNIDLLDGLNPF